MTFLQVLWFILIFVVICGYFVLDGFDLGVGVLYPLLGKGDRDRAVMRRAVGPVWDGNEVWLLTGGGALFAAFAPAYATTFSGFYLAIMLVLFGLILRAVALELGAHDAGARGLWDALFFVGSLLPALLFGVAVGNVLQGIELDAHGDYVGGFFALLNPFALCCGFVGLAQMCASGCAWLAVKTEGDLHDRAVELRAGMQLAALILFVAASVIWFAFVPHLADQGVFALAVVFAVVVAASWLGSWALGRRGAGDLPVFLANSLACVGLCGLTAASLFPYFVPATDAALSITIAGAAGSELTLLVMTVIAVPGVLLVLFYHYLVYKRFAGKVTDADLAAH